MNTTRQYFEQMLFDNFMSQQQAAEIMDAAAAEIAKAPGAEIDWNSPSDNYPPMMLAIVWRYVKAAALVWIDANLPQAFNRPLFE